MTDGFPTHVTPLKECAEPGCTETFKDHRWGHGKAQGQGWFLQRDDTAWCPQHNPDWVAAWRLKQALRKGN